MAIANSSVICVLFVAGLTVTSTELSVQPTDNELKNEILRMNNVFAEMKRHYDKEIEILRSKNAIVETRNHCDKEIAILSSRFKEFKTDLLKEISGLKLTAKIPNYNTNGLFTEKEITKSKPYVDALKDSVTGNQSKEYLHTVEANAKRRIKRTERYVGVKGNSTGHIAFDAYLSHNVENLAVNQAITFDHVNTNLGNLYNPVNGVFTCNKTGTYVFYVRVLMKNPRIFYSSLVVNGSTVHYMYTHNDNNYAHSSTLAIQHLQSGDRVWVQTSDYQEETLQGHVLDHQFCSFAGFLLYQDE